MLTGICICGYHGGSVCLLLSVDVRPDGHRGLGVDRRDSVDVESLLYGPFLSCPELCCFPIVGGACDIIRYCGSFKVPLRVGSLSTPPMRNRQNNVCKNGEIRVSI